MKYVSFIAIGAAILVLAASSIFVIQMYNGKSEIFNANVRALAEEGDIIVIITCSSGICGNCFEEVTAWPLYKCQWTGRPADYCECDKTGFLPL